MKDIDWESLPIIAIAIIGIIGAVLIYNLLNEVVASEPLPELKAEPIGIIEELSGGHSEVEFQQVSEVSELPTERPSKIIYSDDELIAMVVHAEAGGEKLIGRVAVAAVVLNRCDYYGLTVESVVYAKNQFAISDSYTDEDLRAVEIAQKNRDLFPADLMYFRNKHYHSFGKPYMQIGNHYFSTRGE